MRHPSREEVNRGQIVRFTVEDVSSWLGETVVKQGGIKPLQRGRREGLHPSPVQGGGVGGGKHSFGPEKHTNRHSDHFCWC